MQKLNRFVSYVYSYRNGERDSNVGFAKVDCRGEYVRMEIQVRKRTVDREKAVLSLLTGTSGHPIAVPIGAVYFEKETGNYQGRFLAEDIAGSGYAFGQMKGIYLKSEKELFVSQWVEEDFQLSNVEIWEKNEVKREAVPEPPQPEKEPVKENGGATKTETTIHATEGKAPYDWRYEWERLDSGPGSELVLGLALWTRNKGKS